MSNIFPNSMARLGNDTTAGGVDVVMRTKDRPALLERALASVVHQQHANWHLYLVNDGGQAAPVDALVARFAGALAGRVSVIHTPASQGVAAAANVGMAAGQGAFVVLHDDDDSWDPAFLSAGIAFLLAPENRRFGALLTKWNRVEETFDGTTAEVLRANVQGYDGDVVDILDIIRTPQIPPIALLWRRSVAQEAGFFNAQLPVLEDWDLNLRALQLGDIALSPQALANYHIRVSGAAGDYANTITAGLPTHLRYNILYRNSLLRAYLDQEPSRIGLVAALLKNGEQMRQHIEHLQIASHRELSGNQHHINARLDGIEAEVRETRALLEKLWGAIAQST